MKSILRSLFHLFTFVWLRGAIAFVFRQTTSSHIAPSSKVPLAHTSSFYSEASIDESGDVVVKQLKEGVSAREWMESIEQCDGPLHGVGAYTVLRCDATYSTSIPQSYSKGIRWNIWGVDFHLNRLCSSYRMLIDSENTTSHQTLRFEEAKQDTSRLIKVLLDEASRFCFSDESVKSEQEMHRTLMLTVLWTSKSDDLSLKPIIRAHASFAGSVRTAIYDEMPTSISACLALPEKLTIHNLAALPARYTPNKASTSSISTSASAKISSWCRIRRPLEDQSRYKVSKMNVGEVLLVNQYKSTASNFIESLEVLEGLTSNLFVIYKDGTVRTAPATKVLPGYSRHLVMKALHEKSLSHIDGTDLKLDERAPTVQDALHGLWSEVFVTSSIRLVIPVIRLLIPSNCDDDSSDMSVIWHGDGFECTSLIRSAEFQIGIDESSSYI